MRLRFHIGPSEFALANVAEALSACPSVKHGAKLLKEILILGKPPDLTQGKSPVGAVFVDITFSELNPCLGQVYAHLYEQPDHTSRVLALKRLLTAALLRNGIQNIAVKPADSLKLTTHQSIASPNQPIPNEVDPVVLELRDAARTDLNMFDALTNN